MRFYPTYEALKLRVTVPRCWFDISFYPTYEALKLFYNSVYLYGRIRFLPYLWGIETSVILYLPCGNIATVFTLPMRHWNQ